MLHSSVLYFTSSGIWSITRKNSVGIHWSMAFQHRAHEPQVEEPSGQPNQRALEGDKQMQKNPADKMFKQNNLV